MSENVGAIEYEVRADTKQLLEANRAVSQSTTSMESSFKKVDKASNNTNASFTKLSKTSAAVSSALAMPQVEALTKKLSALSGQIGVSSGEMNTQTTAARKNGEALSTVAGILGTSYIGSVGRSTAELLKQTAAAINATNAQSALAASSLEEAVALQAAASALVEKVAAEKANATAVVQAAEADLYAQELLADKAMAADSATNQMLRLAEADLKVAEATGNATLKANAQARINTLKMSLDNQAIAIDAKLTAAENKVAAAKQVEATATEKLTRVTHLETAAKATLANADNALATAQQKATVAAKAQTAAMAGARSVLALLGGPTGVLLLAAAGVYALYKAMSNDQVVDEYKQKLDGLVDKIDELTEKQALALQQKINLQIEADTKDLEKVNNEIKFINDSLNKVKDNKVEVPLSLFGPTVSVDISGYVDEWNKRLVDLNSTAEGLSINLADNAKKIEQIGERLKFVGTVTTEQVKANKILNESTKSLSKSNDLLFDSLHLGDSFAEEEAAIQALVEKFDAAGIGGSELTNAITALRAKFSEKRDLTLESELKTIEQNVKALKIEMNNGAAAAVEYRAAIEAKNRGYKPEDAVAYIKAKREEYDLQQKVNQQNRKSSRGGGENQAAKKIEDLKTKLEALNIVYKKGIKEGTREAEVYNAVQSLGAKATQQQKDQVAALAGQLYDATQRQKDLTAAEEADAERKANRTYADSTAQLKRQLDAQIITQEEYNRQSQQLEQQHQVNLAKIRAEQKTQNAFADMRGEIDPVQDVVNQNNQKLAAMQEYQSAEQALLAKAYQDNLLTYQQYIEAKATTDEQYQALRVAQEKEFNEQRLAAMWQIWQQQNVVNQALGSAFDSLGSTASNALTGIITGSMSASDALRSIGNTILNSVINTFIQMGMEQVKAAIMGQTAREAAIATEQAAATAALGVSTAEGIAAASTLLSSWSPAAMAASIATSGGAATAGMAGYTTAMTTAQTLSLAGARYNGGPVSAGSMYRVGEHGKPEIFQANNGNQYMIPGDSGKVISNKDMQADSRGGAVIHQSIEFNIQTTGSIDDATMAKMAKMMENVSLKTMRNEQRPNGLLRRK